MVFDGFLMISKSLDEEGKRENRRVGGGSGFYMAEPGGRIALRTGQSRHACTSTPGQHFSTAHPPHVHIPSINRLQHKTVPQYVTTGNNWRNPSKGCESFHPALCVEGKLLVPRAFAWTIYAHCRLSQVRSPWPCNFCRRMRCALLPLVLSCGLRSFLYSSHLLSSLCFVPTPSFYAVVVLSSVLS